MKTAKRKEFILIILYLALGFIDLIITNKYLGVSFHLPSITLNIIFYTLSILLWPIFYLIIILGIINIADPDVMAAILFSKLLFLIFLTDLIEDIIEKFRPFYSAIKNPKIKNLINPSFLYLR